MEDHTEIINELWEIIKEKENLKNSSGEETNKVEKLICAIEEKLLPLEEMK